MKAARAAPAPASARLVADCAGLDFLNSGTPSGGTTTDWMGSGEKLLSWLGQAELVPLVTLQHLARNADRNALERVASRARDLREWLRGFVDQHRGRALPDIDVACLELLNRILAEEQKYCQIVAPSLKGGLTLQATRSWMTPESMLLPIAEAVAKLVCQENFVQIKACHGCDLVFIDRTRRQARKWCSMATCGNRAKQAAHRDRRRLPRH
jgi:predicted RNA-binding Zn ribbon-like protein